MSFQRNQSTKLDNGWKFCRSGKLRGKNQRSELNSILVHVQTSAINTCKDIWSRVTKFQTSFTCILKCSKIPRITGIQPQISIFNPVTEKRVADLDIFYALRTLIIFLKLYLLKKFFWKVFIVNFKQISHIALVFPLLTLSK